MILASLRWLERNAAVASAVLLGLWGMPAHGQYGTVSPDSAPAATSPGRTSAGMYPTQRPYQPSIPPYPCLPGMPSLAPEGSGQSGQPGQQGNSAEGPQPTQPSDTTGTTDQGSAGAMDTSSFGAGQDSGLPSEQGAGGGGSAVALAPGGYLDNPIPITTFRMRYDAAWDLNRPDRAEYFYGAYKGLGLVPHGIQNGGAFFDPKARGPNVLAGNVDYQQPEAYFEAAFRNTVSAFVEAPYRFVNFRDIQAVATLPDNQGSQQTSNNGFSDLQFGFKAALLASPTRFLTLQVRAYSPTGNASQGLGTGHWSVEPSLLYYQRFDRLVLQGQMTDWTPIQGGLAGNILEYGGGVGYAVYQRGSLVVMPITEILGWTILNGYETVPGPVSATAAFPLPVSPGVVNADGETIVNAKFGVRTFWGNGNSLYVGYGRALTGTHWYTDIFRVEYRVFFGALRGTARSL